MPGRLHTIASQCSNQRKRTADGWVVSSQQGETPLRYPGYLSTLAGCREREAAVTDTVWLYVFPHDMSKELATIGGLLIR